jgi:DUF4097 and DUF4098 domain-containing protein YvlB
VATANGEVTISASRADHLNATSDSGDVAVQLDSSPIPVTATSQVGSVSARVPDVPGVAYRVDARAESNPTVTVHIDTSSVRTITAHSGRGDVGVLSGTG